MRPIQWIKNLSTNKRRKIIDSAWYAAEVKYSMNREHLREICNGCCHIVLMEAELKREIGAK